MLSLLKVSRPGLWFATIWLYLLPTSQQPDILNSIPFWLGLLYVTFPLNLLVYGWNDIVDFSADKFNPRKDNFLFGAKENQVYLNQLWKKILIVQLIFLPPLIYFGGINFVFLFITFCIINGLYNLPERGLRAMPPLELLCQIGYLLLVPLSQLINNTPSLSTMSYGYLILFAFQSHLIGEVMDIGPDKLAGKKTTATIIGIKNTKLFIILLVALEVLILFYHFHDYIFGGMLAVGLLWLLFDLLILNKAKTYTLNEMKIFGYGSNLLAIASMTYVWWTGCLL